MFSSDFRDAFHSLPLRQDERRYVVSKDLHGRYYVRKVVLFGLAPGPLLRARLASAAMRLSQAVAHDGESSAVCYVDDPLMFVIGQTARLRLLGFLRYVALWTALGLKIVWNKACRGWTVVWIGFEISLHQPQSGDMMVQLTQAKRDKLLSVFDQIAQHKGVFPLKLLQYTAGVLGRVSSVMSLARPYSAMIWAAITQHRTPMRDTTRIRKGLVFIGQVEGGLRWLHALTSATSTDAVGLRRSDDGHLLQC